MRGNPIKQGSGYVQALRRVIRSYAIAEGLCDRLGNRIEWQYAASDVICDILHALDAEGVDAADEIMGRAREHYAAETALKCDCGAAFDADEHPVECPKCDRELAEVTLG